MDTNHQTHKPAGVGRRYQRHSLELKRRIVEQTLVPGASVARIAREHGINANQVFNWRRLYREGLLGTVGAAPAKLLPVTVVAQTRPTAAAPNAATVRTPTVGRIWLDSPKGSLNIDGQPDPVVLRMVLEHLLG